MNKSKVLKTLSKIYLTIGILLLFVGFVILSITFYPQIWYSIDTNATDTEITTIETQVKNLDKEDVKDSRGGNSESNLPPLDSTLPKENTIRISAIGVDSVIVQDMNAKGGLEKGIWIVPNYGSPDKNELPIIIAAHRFGYVYWSPEFRHKSSFYNLPKLKNGDRVQIIWGQRSYEYEVYKSEDNSQVTDYDADLILYTCRMYNSPVRVFRYLKRIK